MGNGVERKFIMLFYSLAMQLANTALHFGIFREIDISDEDFSFNLQYTENIFKLRMFADLTTFLLIKIFFTGKSYSEDL